MIYIALYIDVFWLVPSYLDVSAGIYTVKNKSSAIIGEKPELYLHVCAGNAGSMYCRLGLLHIVLRLAAGPSWMAV